MRSDFSLKTKNDREKGARIAKYIYRNNRTHEEVVVGGGATPHG